MSNVLARKGRQLAKKLISLQIAMTVVMALIFLLFDDMLNAKSALIGGICVVLPSIVFAAFAFKYAGASASRLVMKSFSQGVKLKFGLTILMLAAAFSLLNLPSLPLLVTFTVVTLIQALAPIFFQQQKLG